jgi:hypothetical protein
VLPSFLINTKLKKALAELFAANPIAEAPMQFFSNIATGNSKLYVTAPLFKVETAATLKIPSGPCCFKNPVIEVDPEAWPVVITPCTRYAVYPAGTQ